MFVFSFACVLAQTDPKQHEPETKVPALSAFHEVIYPIWHTYWPEKDYKGLRDMLPEVNEKASAIYDVLLPGFYRERAKKWKSGIAAFRKSVAQFNAAVKGTNDQALLDAAEKLHANYEMLFRILHPVPKSIEYFHKLLYVVYHDYYPNDKYDELKTAAVELKNRSDSIAAQLGRAGISAGKKKAAKEILALQNACDALIKECAKEKPDYNEAVDRVHAAYQKLEARYN